MNLTDVAPAPEYVLGAVACTGLACLMLTSGVILAIVLFRRRRRGSDPTT